MYQVKNGVCSSPNGRQSLVVRHVREACFRLDQREAGFRLDVREAGFRLDPRHRAQLPALPLIQDFPTHQLCWTVRGRSLNREAVQRRWDSWEWGSGRLRQPWHRNAARCLKVLKHLFAVGEVLHRFPCVTRRVLTRTSDKALGFAVMQAKA